MAASQITGTIPLAQLPAVLVTNDQTDLNLSGTFSGDGAGLTDINAATATNLVGVAVSNLVQEVRRVFYVGTNGNDSTAIINNPNFPWAANLNTNGVVFGLATNAGDSVYLLPGTYQVNSIPMATGTIFEGTSRESVLLVMTNLWDVSISSFIPSDNCQLRNFSWVATNTGWTSFMMNYPTPSFTNVLIDNLNIYADYDTFYHGPDGQPNDATYKLTIQNSTIRAVWDLLVPNCQGSFQSFNNVYIADNLTTEDFYGTGIGSNVFCTRITTPLMEFDDWGSRFYGFGKTNISNSAWWGFGGRASLHGSVFYCGFTNQLPLPTGYAGSTSIQVSGDYIDGNTGIPYSWGPDKAGWQVDSITTNVLIILDTNHVIITQSEIDAFNGTNTWNADIGAWTNGTTVLIISGGYGEIGTGPAATLDGTESYDTDGGLPVPIYGLQTTAWTTSDGTASALQTRFMTNGTTEVYATNYYPVIFGGGVNQRNGTVNFSGNGNAVTNIPLTGLQAMPLTNNQAGVALDGTFSGDGGGLTNLNASNLAGGTVSDALLSANVPLLNGNQTFGGSNNFAGVVTATNANNTLNGTFTGNVNGTVTGDLVGPASLATNFIGSLSGDVTGTQGATVVSGVGGQTAADVAAGAVLANAATSNNTAGAIVRRDASGNFAAGTVTASFAGDGNGLTNMPLTGLQVMPLVNNQTGVILDGFFSGDGSGLAILNASSLASGTVADDRLSANVPLLNGANAFTDSNTYAGVITATNANNTFNGAYTGNGGGLINVPGAQPWQVVAGTSVQAAPNYCYLTTNSSQVTVTLPSVLNPGDIVRVSGAGLGGWKIAQNAGQSVVASFGPSLQWSAGASSQSWNRLASSADGTRLVATTSSGSVYTSMDSGTTWALQSGAPGGVIWNSLASSADGMKLVGSVSGAGASVYTSVNGGTNWALQGGSPNLVNVVTVSSDGTLVTAFASGSGIYTSNDSGTNWANQAGAPMVSWTAAAVTPDGSKLVAAVSSGTIYTSTDNGTNWTTTTAPSLNWSYVAISADGTKLAATVTGGCIYTSGNSGTSWNQSSAPSANWSSIAMSSDGTKMLAANNGGYLYVSSDSGLTWNVQTGAPSASWAAVAATSDGGKFMAAPNGSSIYASLSSTTAGTAGYLTGGRYSAVELQYIGGGVFMPVSYTGNLAVY